MIAASPCPPGRPASRRGQSDAACTGEKLTPPSRVFAFPAASRFSSKARLFASAATGGGNSTSDHAVASACRSRVKVWEATSDAVAQQSLSSSCAPAVSRDSTAAASSRSQSEQQSRAAEVEWSRQFLGHSINAVLFAPLSQRTNRGANSLSPSQGDVIGCDGSSSEDDEEDTVLLIGTDKGMVAAADVSGRCGSKLLYAIHLGDAYAGGGSDGNLPRLSSSTSVSSGYDSSASGTAMAAAGMATGSSAVYDLRAMPGRSDAVLALVGCLEGSTIYLLNVQDGSVLQEDALSKLYTLMATPSRLLPHADCVDGDGGGFSACLQQLALLGCGTARRVDRETALDQSPRSGVLFLFDVAQRKQWLKLTGASTDSCCSLALHDRLEFAAACFYTNIREQQTQLLLWQLPSRTCDSSEKCTAARRKKLPPVAMAHFFEGLVQLLLPITSSISAEEKGSRSAQTLDGTADAGSGAKEFRQVLLGLSRSSVIAMWGCFSTVTGDSRGASVTLELLLQVDTAAPACVLPSAVSPRDLSARLPLAAAAQAPGVWYIEQGIDCRGSRKNSAVEDCTVHTPTRKAIGSCEQSTARTRKELTLRVVRGSYAVPVFDSVVLPFYFDSSNNHTPHHLYLPLLPSSNGKLSRDPQNVVRPLSAKEIKQIVRKDLNQRDNTAAHDGCVNEEGGSPPDAAREFPTVCLKRKIGAACDSEGQGGKEASGRKEGQRKGRKALGLFLTEKVGGAGAEKSSVASILRQALVTSDARLLESVLSSTAKDKKEVAAAVASLTPARALLLLQHLVQQQQTSPATSILKGPWIEELVKQHGVVLGTTEAGREQLVLLLLQVEERRRAEAALVKVKGRVELLLQEMRRIQKLKEQRRKDEIEAREPLVVHREHARP